MSVKQFKHKIKVMKWSGFGRNQSYVFAFTESFLGKLILKMKGYKKHMTFSGCTYRKPLYTTKRLK